MRAAALILGCFMVGMWCYAIYIALYLAAKRGELTRTWWLIGLPPIVVGYLIDVLLLNWVIATAVYGEFPKERTFTQRLKRKYRSFVESPHALDRRIRFTLWWVVQLNALTPAHYEHIHNYDRPDAPTT